MDFVGVGDGHVFESAGSHPLWYPVYEWPDIVAAWEATNETAGIDGVVEVFEDLVDCPEICLY